MGQSRSSTTEVSIHELESKLIAIQQCLAVLHKRVIDSKNFTPGQKSGILKSALDDIMKLSKGDTQLSKPLAADDVIKEERSHKQDIDRLLALVEKLKSSDISFLSNQTEIDGSSSPPKDLSVSLLPEDAAAQLFAKRVSWQLIPRQAIH